MEQRTRTKLLTMTAIVLLVGMLPGSAAAVGSQQARVWITVDGRAAEVTKGAVIEGTKDAQGRCSLHSVEVSIEDSPSVPSGAVDFTVDDQACRLVVDNIEFPQIPRVPSYTTGNVEPLSHVNGWVGWAEAKYQEQVHIDVAKVHVEMIYTDTGTEVLSGRSPNPWC